MNTPTHADHRLNRQNRKTIGIFRSSYPHASETFIANQARALRHFRPLLLVRKQVGPITLPHASPAATFRGKLMAALFAATGAWPFFWARERADDLALIHAHFGPDGLYGLQLAGHLGIPLVVTFHGSDCTTRREVLARSRVWSNIRFVIGENRLKSGAACVIAISDFIRGRLIEQGYPADRVVRHYIGVDTEYFSPIEAGSTRDDYVLCVARHTEVKGIDRLLQAFAQLRPGRSTRLVLVGSGPLTPALQAQAVALGIAEAVDFLGAQPPETVRQLMRQASIFALFGQVAASGAEEGLGLVFNEASACATPVVATRVGGIPEAVLDGSSGYLVEPADVAGFADRLRRLLDDPALARRMGEAGREHVCRHFDLRRQSAELESIYDRVLQVARGTD